METSNREWDKPDYHWHTCENCGRQCPHEGVTCRCPWCKQTHATTKQFDFSGDGDGIRHIEPMDELTCQIAVIAGWLRLINGTGGITYEGEKTLEHAWSGEIVTGLVINHPDLKDGIVYMVRDMRSWRYAQDNWAVLKKLGTPNFDEERKAA